MRYNRRQVPFDVCFLTFGRVGSKTWAYLRPNARNSEPCCYHCNISLYSRNSGKCKVMMSIIYRVYRRLTSCISNPSICIWRVRLHANRPRWGSAVELWNFHRQLDATRAKRCADRKTSDDINMSSLKYLDTALLYNSFIHHEILWRKIKLSEIVRWAWIWFRFLGSQLGRWH